MESPAEVLDIFTRMRLGEVTCQGPGGVICLQLGWAPPLPVLE